MRPQILPFTFGDEPANAGDIASVQCTVVKGDSPLEITWTFNGVTISNKLGLSITKMNQRISALTIEAVTAEHRGEYTCSARNLAGVFSHASFLNVNGKIIIF